MAEETTTTTTGTSDTSRETVNSAVGETVELADGTVVVVRSVDIDDQVVLIRVRGCAGADAGPNTGIAPELFALELPGDRLVLPVAELAPRPPLEPTRLGPGECASGAIGYALPRGAQPDFVRLRGPVTVRWRIPPDASG